VSILLEALRKSEKNQNPPEAPSIHTDEQVGRLSDSIPTGPLALLLVVALFVGGWFTWNQYRAPAGQYQPPVTLAAGESSPVGSGDTEKQPGSGQDAQDTAASGQGAQIAEQAEQKVPPPKVADNSAERPRTPVERFQKTSNDKSKSIPDAKGKPEAPTKSRPATKAEASQPASVDTASGQQNEIANEKFRPQEPAPISYWELPDAIRENVPEIKFSVLVYAVDPADRFVLINGQRLAEGDNLQSGPAIKEIRRDGVVFSYRLYQFLVER